MESDTAFVAPEGVYSVTEEHKPLPVLSHSSTSAHPIYHTRLSTITVRFPHKHPASPGIAQFLGANLTKDLKKEKDKDKDKDRDKDKDAFIKERPQFEETSMSSSDTPDDSFTSPDVATPDLTVSTPAEPQHKLFSHPSISAGKKKPTMSRPKHNMRTTSSTFITRLQSIEGLNKILSSKQGDVTFLFYNTGKAFLWVEVGNKTKEPLTRISFSAYPTCHDVNPSTASSERLDVIIGFSTGDLIWFDPMSSRYCRLNKQGTISSSHCTAVRWVPSSPTLFLVSHADGTIIVYDKEREDGLFTANVPIGLTNTIPHLNTNVNAPASPTGDGWDPLSSIFVTPPPWHPEAAGRGEKGVVAKNPVSHWRLSRRSVVDFVFSPDVKYVAAISEDGCLRVIDPLAEQLVDCYASYFGALTCVAWSPDGRFILTGGQDDLLTIFSPWEQRVVARCQGHSSFVSAVAFDELRCDGRTYRFGSVGEDNKLILWDFSSGALHRPKLFGVHHTRISISSCLSLAYRRGTGSTIQLSATRYHPAPSRNEVSTVQPVLVKQLDADLLTSLTFLPRGLLTATKAGYIRLWVRPLAMTNAGGKRRGHMRGVPSMTDLHGVFA
ncbi:WD40 repeat-like protein [Rhizopogon vinicolor AM-OR11-026]|uniref:WD40 repeat-like protein n=1 Tax=Rhizopogon vinicolor AM-OR11-026 TaxID=1314800 RepID=A0A1B7NIA7_9AGAM|nr:WD40 repeat-like protein [Rhizopogon vinicolor AM-OR11-026]